MSQSLIWYSYQSQSDSFEPRSCSFLGPYSKPQTWHPGDATKRKKPLCFVDFFGLFRPCDYSNFSRDPLVELFSQLGLTDWKMIHFIINQKALIEPLNLWIVESRVVPCVFSKLQVAHAHSCIHEKPTTCWCLFCHEQIFCSAHLQAVVLPPGASENSAHTCKHTPTHTHTMSFPLSKEQQMVYLSTNKIVLKDQAVHFQAKVNWFFHHVYPAFLSSQNIRAKLSPFSADPTVIILVR